MKKLLLGHLVALTLCAMIAQPAFADTIIRNAHIMAVSVQSDGKVAVFLHGGGIVGPLEASDETLGSLKTMVDQPASIYYDTELGEILDVALLRPEHKLDRGNVSNAGPAPTPGTPSFPNSPTLGN